MSALIAALCLCIVALSSDVGIMLRLPVVMLCMTMLVCFSIYSCVFEFWRLCFGFNGKFCGNVWFGVIWSHGQLCVFLGFERSVLGHLCTVYGWFCAFVIFMCTAMVLFLLCCLNSVAVGCFLVLCCLGRP